MNRKDFLTAVTASAIGASALAACSRDDRTSGQEGPGRIGSIGGKSLEKLRSIYRADLFDDFLPQMDQVVIDREYGGFICGVDIRTGKPVSTDKRAWYEGRGMWVYAHLYNTLDRNPAWLDIARASKEFIMKNRPPDNRFWAVSFSREGEPLSREEGDIYGNLFVAEGLAEYAAASGEEESFDLAKKLILDAMDRYDQPGYSYRGGPAGLRYLGHWMVFLISTSHMLRHRSDARLEAIADRCIEAIMSRHLHPRYRLLNETLAHDFYRPEEYSQQVTGHAIETLWMVMYEAARREDAALFREAADLFRRHVEVARDPVYGGYFSGLNHVDNYTWAVNKVLWLQEEVLIGTMLMIEHLNDPWAKEVFTELDAWVREKFVRPGHRFWIISGNRTVDQYNPNRAGNYHHPRHLMLNLLSIERMLERNGRVSDLFHSDA